jgi:hypothetical protein
VSSPIQVMRLMITVFKMVLTMMIMKEIDVPSIFDIYKS